MNKDVAIMLVISFSIFAVVIIFMIASLGFSPNRLITEVIYWLNLPVFPEARAIQRLIYQFPEQWTSTEHRLTHPVIGSIWIANESYGITIESDFGTWKPSVIERRIIRDAVDWRIGQYIRHRIGQALNKSFAETQPKPPMVIDHPRG